MTSGNGENPTQRRPFGTLEELPSDDELLEITRNCQPETQLQNEYREGSERRIATIIKRQPSSSTDHRIRNLDLRLGLVTQAFLGLCEMLLRQDASGLPRDKLTRLIHETNDNAALREGPLIEVQIKDGTGRLNRLVAAEE